MGYRHGDNNTGIEGKLIIFINLLKKYNYLKIVISVRVA
jgi:hypothetical protein